MRDQIATEQPLPFWLEGNFGPVSKETTANELEVIGEIPAELNGRYLRIGPDPKSGHSDHWFMGDGMVHGVELSAGKVNWYRNRFVQTPIYNKATPGYDIMDALGGLDHSVANTHIVSHAGKILALEELHHPFEMTPELETVGAYDFDGSLKTGMTAHPKLCAKTGELLFFAYSLLPPYLTYHRVSPEGKLVQSEAIDVKGATMVHDFNITENYVIFMDLPLMFDIGDMSGSGMPLKWNEEYGARLGVMPRNGGNNDVVWYEIDPCYVYHPVNAYESGNKIVIDVCRRDHYLKPGVAPAFPLLYRWEIDQDSGATTSTQLGDIPVEFPRIPDRLVGQPYRYGYLLELELESGATGIGIQKYDFDTNTHRSHALPEHQRCGEPVFVPSEKAEAEDDGYLLCFVYDHNEEKSQLVILDARNIEAEPLARIKLPVRVPYGFHGSWIAD